LILRKISKISANSCQISRLKCTIFDFHSTPDWRSLQHSPDVFRGLVPRREGKIAPTVGDSGSSSGERKGRKKGKERSLSWGVQELIFHFKH